MAAGVLALSLASCGTAPGVEVARISAIERVEFSREAIFGDDAIEGRVSVMAWLDAETLLCVGDEMLLLEMHVPSRRVRRRRMSGPRDFTGNQDVQAMAVLDERHVAFGTTWGSVVVYDLRGSRFVGEATRQRDSDGAVYACAWRGPREVLAAFMGGRILGFKLPEFEEVEVEPDARGYVDFGPGGHILIPWGERRDAVLRDPQGNVVWRRGAKDPVGHVRYVGATSSDGRFAAMGRFDESIDLVEVDPVQGVSWSELRPRRPQPTCHALAFLPGTHELVVAWGASKVRGGTLEVFDAQTRESVARLDLEGVNLSGWPRTILAVSSARYLAMQEPSAGVMIFRIVGGGPASSVR